jgi:hypothetical protein
MKFSFSIPSINETYFLPFELACASNHSRMIDTSLDCLQVKRFLPNSSYVFLSSIETSFKRTFNW